MAKVSDWNSFRVYKSYSDSFRYLYPSQCESFQTNPKNVLYLVWWKTVKNQFDLIRLIPRHQSAWILTNPNPSFQSRSIRINAISDWSLNHSDLGLMDWIDLVLCIYSFLSLKSNLRKSSHFLVNLWGNLLIVSFSLLDFNAVTVDDKIIMIAAILYSNNI